MSLARTHTDAIVALLDTIPRDIPVSVGEAPAGANCCIVVWPSGGLQIPDAIKTPTHDFEMDFQITCVGTTAEQALWVHDNARAVLDRQTPTVSGRTCWPIWADEQPQPVRRDDAVNPPLYVAISRWSIRSTT